MSVRRRSFETGDGGRLGLQRALRVLGDTCFAVTVHGRCSGRGGGGGGSGGGGGGGTVGACLGVF